MEQEFKIISEDEKSYLAEIDGKPVKLFKINLEELEFKHTNDLFNASGHIPLKLIDEILFFTDRLLKFIPSVNEYEPVAKQMVGYMNKIYDILKPHKLSHLMHHLVKDTDPNIYGKAQTIMKNIERLHKDLEKMKEFLDNS